MTLSEAAIVAIRFLETFQRPNIFTVSVDRESNHLVVTIIVGRDHRVAIFGGVNLHYLRDPQAVIEHDLAERLKQLFIEAAGRSPTEK